MPKLSEILKIPVSRFRYEDLRRLGYCRCYRELDNAKSKCEYCLLKHRFWAKGWRNKLRSLGLCGYCGRKIYNSKNKKYCLRCYAKRRLKENKINAGRVAKDRCSCCPKPVSKTSKWLCTEHSARHAQIKAKYYKKNRDKINFKRRNAYKRSKNK